MRFGKFRKYQIVMKTGYKCISFLGLRQRLTIILYIGLVDYFFGTAISYLNDNLEFAFKDCHEKVTQN